MAANDATATDTGIQTSLPMEETPMKLRCSVCSLLAVNAVRMPCCDQNICSNCEENLGDECRVCLHTPVAKDLCRPNKSLRTTIKAFLRKKLVEKENLRKKELAARAAFPTTTPTLPEITDGAFNPLKSEYARVKTNGSVDINGTSHTITLEESSGDPAVEAGNDTQRSSNDAQMDIPRPSIEMSIESVPVIARQSSVGSSNDKGVERRNSGASIQLEENGESQPNSGQWPANENGGSVMSNSAFGFNSMTGGVPMDFSQMMQFMPNGMPNNLMGTFPNLIGMPAMGMDQMAMTQAMSQQIYGGFGGPGMGMNGMNMGMGFNAGQGVMGGFNGQPDAWITGQNNYNANAYGTNGMVGNYGAHAGPGGYNMSSHQGNFSQLNHQQYQNNDYQNGYNNHGFQTRGRGRRGGHYNGSRGRDGYGHMNQGNHNANANTNYEPFHHQLPPHVSQYDTDQPHSQEQQQPTSEEKNLTEESRHELNLAETDNTEAIRVEQIQQDPKPESAAAQPELDLNLADSVVGGQSDQRDPEVAKEIQTEVENSSKEAEVIEQVDDTKLLPIETFISPDEMRAHKPHVDGSSKHYFSTAMPPPSPAIPLGPAAQYSQDHIRDQTGWARGAGRGYRGLASGRGEYRGRGGTFLANGNGGIHSSPVSAPLTNCSPPVAPVEPKGVGVEGAPTGPKALRERLPTIGLRSGRGFSIVGRGTSSMQGKPNGSTRSRSPSISRHRTRSRSRSPELSRHHSSRHQGYHHRSRSESSENERERRRERHRHQSRKYDEEENVGQNHDESRKREVSADSSSKRSSCRSRRHHEKQLNSTSYRHHRDRSRDRDRGRDEERRHRRKRSRSPTSVGPTPTSANPLDLGSTHEQVKDELIKRRDKDRDRDGEEGDRHRERKRSRRDASLTQEDNRSSRRKIRDGNDKRDISKNNKTDVRGSSIVENNVERSQLARPVPTGPKEPEKDHHTLEREARNRERLMKEMQRRAATEGAAPKRKTSGLEGRMVNRRMSYKYEDDESEEARTARIEIEREAGRWG